MFKQDFKTGVLVNSARLIIERNTPFRLRWRPFYSISYCMIGFYSVFGGDAFFLKLYESESKWKSKSSCKGICNHFNLHLSILSGVCPLRVLVQHHRTSALFLCRPATPEPNSARSLTCRAPRGAEGFAAYRVGLADAARAKSMEVRARPPAQASLHTNEPSPSAPRARSTLHSFGSSSLV